MPNVKEIYKQLYSQRLDDPIFKNELDKDHNPSGGYSIGIGFIINWQEGPIKEFGRNGAMIEPIIETIINRLEFFQDSKFRCEQNENALIHLKMALGYLNERTKEREDREVEGTYKI